MNTTVRNILVFIGGGIVGSVVNMGLILIGGSIFPLAEGFDPMNATSWELKYFLFPWLAHAGGTLAGAFFAAKFSASHHLAMALGIGFLFLIGGIMAVFMIPAPIWFVIADLLLAYIPMGWLGWKIGRGGR